MRRSSIHNRISQDPMRRSTSLEAYRPMLAGLHPMPVFARGAFRSWILGCQIRYHFSRKSRTTFLVNPGTSNAEPSPFKRVEIVIHDFRHFCRRFLGQKTYPILGFLRGSEIGPPTFSRVPYRNKRYGEGEEEGFCRFRGVPKSRTS